MLRKKKIVQVLKILKNMVLNMEQEKSLYTRQNKMGLNPVFI